MIDTERNAEFLEEIKKRLTEPRFIHSINVADEAKNLAKKYGADPEKAYTAGLLHDILKDTPKKDLLNLLTVDYCVPLSPVELLNNKLWHAIAGSLFIEKELNVTDKDIISAVRYHTTAKPDMNPLEKVVYIADFISADRTYDGVDRMREKTAISLDLAMREGLQFSIIKLVTAEKAIHPDSVNAYNQIIEGVKE